VTEFGLQRTLRFRIAYQTIKNYWKTTVILTFLFILISAMYAGMFPAFKDSLPDMVDTFKGSMSWFPGIEDITTYSGWLNVEMYQIFWILILGIILGFIAASVISKEVEGKTIDLLMSNPVSRKQIVFEKFVGLIPVFLVINFATMLSVIGFTVAINEELDYGNLFLTHLAAIPYFLAVLSIGILISVILNEKMKASIAMITIIVGMFFVQSISLSIPSYEKMGWFSINHYYNTADILIHGNLDPIGMLVLSVVTAWCLIIAMIYFEHRDIEI